MAIAFDAQSNVAASTTNLSWTHTPVGTPRGVVIQIIQNLGTTDEVTSVLYGGVSVDRISGATVFHTNGSEDGTVYTYFIGRNIPTGAQTIEVNVNGTGSSKIAAACSVTASGNTKVDCFNTLDSAGTSNPSVTLTVAYESFIMGALLSGRTAVEVSAGVDYTQIVEATMGGGTASFQYRTTNGSPGNVAVDWQQTFSDEAGIGAIGISELVDRSIILHISGHSPANSNTNLFILGLETLNNNITLFEEGSSSYSSINNSLNLYISGLININNNFTLFEQGLISINSNIPLYISSFNNINNNFTLFEQGIDNISNNIPLFIGGLSSFDNSALVFPLYECGHLIYNNNLPLYIHGYGLISNENPPDQLPLYIQGSIIDNLFNTIPLFIGGYSSLNTNPSIFTLFEQGSVLVASGLPLFIYGQGIITTDTPPPNQLPLYIAGPFNPNGYIPLYICGPSIVRMCQFTRYINRITQVDLEI